MLDRHHLLGMGLLVLSACGAGVDIDEPTVRGKADDSVTADPGERAVLLQYYTVDSKPAGLTVRCATKVCQAKSRTWVSSGTLDTFGYNWKKPGPGEHNVIDVTLEGGGARVQEGHVTWDNGISPAKLQTSFTGEARVTLQSEPGLNSQWIYQRLTWTDDEPTATVSGTAPSKPNVAVDLTLEGLTKVMVEADQPQLIKELQVRQGYCPWPTIEPVDLEWTKTGLRATYAPTSTHVELISRSRTLGQLRFTAVAE
jgi:hypothetical protein